MEREKNNEEQEEVHQLLVVGTDPCSNCFLRIVKLSQLVENTFVLLFKDTLASFTSF